MGETEVKIQLSLGSTVLREWKEVHNPNLPETLNSLKHLKESINDFLTDLICKKKDLRGREFLEQVKDLKTVQENVEDEDLEEDPLTEILEEIMSVNERLSKKDDIRSICCNSLAKRFKN